MNNGVRHCIASCELTLSSGWGAPGAWLAGQGREAYQYYREGHPWRDVEPDIRNNTTGVLEGLAAPPTGEAPVAYCQRSCEEAWYSGMLE